MRKIPYGVAVARMLFTQTLLKRLPDTPGTDPLEAAFSITQLIIEINEVRAQVSALYVTDNDFRVWETI